MNTLKKLKLNQLNKAELEKRAMDALRGGNDCGDCVCVCAGEYLPFSSNPIESHRNTATAYVPKGN